MNNCFYEILNMFNLILIKIIGIDNIYFTLLYCNKLNLSFLMIQAI